MIGWLIRQRLWGTIRTNPNNPRAAGYQPNQPGDKPVKEKKSDNNRRRRKT